MGPRIHPATLSDISALAKISADSFVLDRHTQMKALGKIPYDLEAMWKNSLPQLLASTKVVTLKAVDEESGEVMGWMYWGFEGFGEDEVDDLRGYKPSAPPLSPPGTAAVTSEVDDQSAPTSDAEDERERGQQRSLSSDTPTSQTLDDPIARLEAMTDADMSRWAGIFMPPGTKCMYIGSLSVAPKWQSRGAGSMLLKWGTAVADMAGIFI